MGRVSFPTEPSHVKHRPNQQSEVEQNCPRSNFPRIAVVIYCHTIQVMVRMWGVVVSGRQSELPAWGALVQQGP